MQMIRIDESKWLSVCWDWGLNGEGHSSISFGNKKDGEHGIFSGLLWGRRVSWVDAPILAIGLKSAQRVETT